MLSSDGARGAAAVTRGFTLIEVVITLAVIAVMAGTLLPLVSKQIDRARRAGTYAELQVLEDAMHDYYDDCRRLPPTDVGLAALVSDLDDCADWKGPYVGDEGDLVEAATRDAWENAYTYERAPTVRSGGVAGDYLLISPGGNEVLDSRRTGRGWILDADADIVVNGSVSEEIHDLRAATRTQLETLRTAFERLYVDVSTFPAVADSLAIVELLSSSVAGWQGPYLTRGDASDWVRDGWGNAIRVDYARTMNGERVDGWFVASSGEDGTDIRRRGGDRWQGASLWLGLSEVGLTALRNGEVAPQAETELRLIAGSLYEGFSVSPPTGDIADTLPWSLDPWGRRYGYTRHSAYAGIAYSRGPDGRAGTADDIQEGLIWRP